MFEKITRKIYIRSSRYEPHDINDEWFKYLQREYPGPLIGDKYLGSVVDKMKLRFSTILPILFTGLCEGYKETHVTIGYIYAAIGIILALILLLFATLDLREAIDIRKTLIKKT